MRTLCASTLICEFFVIGFAGLVAMKLSDLSMGTVWTVSGIAMGLCVLLSGMLRWPWALQVGWVLQIGLVLSGFVVPVMFFLGLAFAGLWWASIHYGRHIDEAKARFAAMDEAARELAEARAAAGGTGSADEAGGTYAADDAREAREVSEPGAVGGATAPRQRAAADADATRPASDPA
ncbi:DUF4233 domain-containing protein [Streptomyces sp. AC563]|nr:DUF4233 domain-containing protein [Streptomyces buecherae]